MTRKFSTVSFSEIQKDLLVRLLNMLKCFFLLMIAMLLNCKYFCNTLVLLDVACGTAGFLLRLSSDSLFCGTNGLLVMRFEVVS